MQGKEAQGIGLEEEKGALIVSIHIHISLSSSSSSSSSSSQYHYLEKVICLIKRDLE